MRLLTTLSTLLLALTILAPGATIDPQERLRAADALYEEGSYEPARAIYAQLAAVELPAGSARWIRFRLADATWRASASSSNPDSTDPDEARASLEAIVREAARLEDRDVVWAEAQESLGDFWWIRRGAANWSAAWPHYQAALDWWAGSIDLRTARDRYLGIVWKASSPPWSGRHEAYGSHGNRIPLEVLTGAQSIAADAASHARASYLVALSLMWRGTGQESPRRIEEAFEAAMAGGVASDWHDDALFRYAEWLATSGRAERSPAGGWQVSPDFPRALAVYRRLLASYGEGESRYRDQAARRVEEITSPAVGVAIGSTFLAGSEIPYYLSWRNTGMVRLFLHRVDLTRDVGGHQTHDASWIGSIDLAGRAPLRSWTHDTGDDGSHAPGQASLVLPKGLPLGAYLIRAEAGGRESRDLILVTGAALVLKTSAREALVWVCDGRTGEPRAHARVTLWIRENDRDARWRPMRVTADADGLALFRLPADHYGGSLLATAAQGEDQAYGTAWIGRAHRSEGEWRIHAFTDRPAYRPAERTHWKIMARLTGPDTTSIPAGAELSWEIRDPKGAVVRSGKETLNRFGSAWGDLDLHEAMTLGEYRIRFTDPARDIHLGESPLFRLEEYRLPEFEARVLPPEREGAPGSPIAGERVETTIEASYYFGGPVAGATVEVIVTERPLTVSWEPSRADKWLADEIVSRWDHHPSREVLRTTVATDARGRARLAFDTPAGSPNDLEYAIEARVTDASRREVTARGSVAVGRTAYQAFLRPDHLLHRPGSTVRIAIKTIDAGRRPVRARGRTVVTRDRWVERDSFRGYEQVEVLSRRLATSETGDAALEFTAPVEGYYRIAWIGDPVGETAPVVRGETVVWVADRTSRDLGFRAGGVGIVLDESEARAGRPMAVMITAPVSGTWVLFSVESEVLHDARVVRIPGTVALLDLPIDEPHVPNVWLEAALVRDGELMVDARELMVPPVDRFLEIEVTSDRRTYRPRDRAVLTIATRDRNGRPVAAEVALGLVDASVYAIRSDYAGDPRPFFFGRRRGRGVTTRGSFHEKRYTSLSKDDRGALVDGLAERHGYRDEDKARNAAPLPASESVAAKSMARRERAGDDAVGRLSMSAEPASQVEARTDFRATAFWRPDVTTGPDGTATIEVDLPESLTTWRATARGADPAGRVGIITMETTTSLPLMARLQAPRFLVAGDTATISALVDNATPLPMTAEVTLEAEGLSLQATGSRRVEVPANGQSRVEWIVSADEAGRARLRVAARADGHADSMERFLPVFEHGVEKLLAAAGMTRGDAARASLDLPAARRKGSARMTVRVTSSPAATMLDALPYLIEYPYGCTEQTMSRFLPAVLVARALHRLGVSPAAVERRVFSSPRPDGPRGLSALQEVTRAGLLRLYDFQHGDGGWGWWKEGDSDHFMSAYVVWGLALAAEAGVDVDGTVLSRGAQFLDRELVEREEQPDMQAWMLHAVAAASPARGSWATGRQKRAFENLWNRRDRLNAWTRAMLALAAHRAGEAERAGVLVRNLTGGVRRHGSGDTATARWGEDGVAGRWSDGAVEPTAFVLKALLAIEPGSDLVEPAVTWLVKNRRGAQWSSTRDTAFVVMTLTDYLDTTAGLEADLEVEVLVNGRALARRALRGSDGLPEPARFDVDPSWLVDGSNTVAIRRLSGSAPIHYSVEATFFSLEEPVTPAGNEIHAERRYLQLAPRPTLLKGHRLERLPLPDGGALASGERVEVVLTVTSENDYEYLLFEDLKPAGFEAVELLSGGGLTARELNRRGIDRDPAAREETDYTGRTRFVHRELRDRKVALFLDRLPQGTWEIRYELRAETPGSFHALPVLGHAMYVPEIRCNGAEVRITIPDAAP